MEKKGVRFIQLSPYESQGTQSIDSIINHSLAQVQYSNRFRLIMIKLLNLYFKSDYQNPIRWLSLQWIIYRKNK